MTCIPDVRCASLKVAGAHTMKTFIHLIHGTAGPPYVYFFFLPFGLADAGLLVAVALLVAGAVEAVEEVVEEAGAASAAVAGGGGRGFFLLRGFHTYEGQRQICITKSMA